MQNDLEEFFAMVDFTVSGVLGTCIHTSIHTYTHTHIHGRHTYAERLGGVFCHGRFHQSWGPGHMRRLQKEVSEPYYFRCVCMCMFITLLLFGCVGQRTNTHMHAFLLTQFSFLCRILNSYERPTHWQTHTHTHTHLCDTFLDMW